MKDYIINNVGADDAVYGVDECLAPESEVGFEGSGIDVNVKSTANGVTSGGHCGDAGAYNLRPEECGTPLPNLRAEGRGIEHLVDNLANGERFCTFQGRWEGYGWARL